MNEIIWQLYRNKSQHDSLVNDFMLLLHAKEALYGKGNSEYAATISCEVWRKSDGYYLKVHHWSIRKMRLILFSSCILLTPTLILFHSHGLKRNSKKMYFNWNNSIDWFLDVLKMTISVLWMLSWLDRNRTGRKATVSVQFSSVWGKWMFFAGMQRVINILLCIK